MRLFFILLMEMKSPAKLKSHPHNRKDQKAHFDSSAILTRIRHHEMKGYFPMNLVDKRAWKDQDPFCYPEDFQGNIGNPNQNTWLDDKLNCGSKNFHPMLISFSAISYIHLKLGEGKGLMDWIGLSIA